MYSFESVESNRRNYWEKELEKFFDVFSREDYFAPKCEILDEEKSYRVSLDIPGVRKENLDIEVKDNHLHISGVRSYSEKTKKDNILRTERSYGKFSRVFGLPQNVNSDLIEAHFENGVLDLTLPKEEKSQSKKIKISSWDNDAKTDLNN